MNKADCSVIKDLLPLYIDDVCGAESKELVEEHVKQCKECTAEKAKMKGEIELPKDTGIKALMNIQITISKRVKRVFVLLGSLLLGVIITVAVGIFLTSYRMPVTYEDIDGNFITFDQGDEITIVAGMNDYYRLYNTVECVGEDEDGVRLNIIYYCYVTTPMIELRKGIADQLLLNGYDNQQSDWIWSTGLLHSEDGNEDWKPISRTTAIYYLPLEEDGVLPADKSDAVLIWSEDESVPSE